MKIITPLIAYLFLPISFLQASSIETIIGRYYLTQKNLTYANSMFAQGSDAEAKTLKALSSLALLQRDSGTVTFLNNLYVDSPANIWDAKDVGYSPNPSQPNPYRAQNNANANQISSILKNSHLPVYLQAENDLSTFTSDTLLVPLGRSETGYPDINLDRGDILMIRALLACGRGVAYLVNSQNSNILINEYISLEEEPGPVTIEKFLAKFADAAKLANASDLPLARQEFKNSIALYKQASEWVRTKRAANAVRLFNLPGSLGVKSGEVYSAGLADEVKFRAKLDEYALLLDGSRLLTGLDNKPIETLNAKPFFDGSVNLRSILPSFRKNKIRQGDVTDAFAKAGGVYPGNTIARTESWLLQETRGCALNPYALGLFVPPRLSVTSPTGNSVTEGYQPADSFLALGYSWGYFEDDGIGLFWINPQIGGFSKLNSTPVISDSLFPQQNWVSGSSIYIKSHDYSTWPERVILYEISQIDGHLIRTIALSDIITFSNGYQLIEGGSDFIVILNSNIDWNWHIYRLNKATLALQEVSLGSNRLSYFSWDSATLDQSKECIWLAGGNENTSGTSYFKFRISDGELLQTIPNINLSNLQSAVAGKNGIIAVKVNWPTCSLISISYSTGRESVLNPDLFPGRPLMSWTSKLTLDSSGDNVFLSSVDWNWENPIIHKFSTLNGQTIANYVIGQGNSYFFMIAPTSGANAFSFRTGDVSERISVSFSISGTASNGLDYTFPTTPVSFQPGNTQQPIPFGLVNDNVVEFDETVVLTGTPNPESDSTFQPFTLTIQDDDGSGVGIVATDNVGKEGRMNPDPFGFRFGVYDPIRFEVRRTGSTASAISVKVSRDALLSSASTDDYEITGFDVDGQSVRIPAGKSSAEILVSPKFDINYPEGTESLTLKITADPAYTVMEASSATGSIADSSPYEWWSYQMGLLVAKQSPSLDTDKDGMSNLLEMAFGRDPNLPDSQNSVNEGVDNEGYLTLTYKRWTGGTTGNDGSYSVYGVTYRPQAASSLELPAWSTASIQVRSVTDMGDGMEEVVVRDTLSKSQPRRFMRLAVSL